VSQAEKSASWNFPDRSASAVTVRCARKNGKSCHANLAPRAGNYHAAGDGIYRYPRET